MAGALASSRAVAQRGALAPSAAHQRGRTLRVAAQYTPEQLAFVQRKKAEAAEQASASNGAANPVPYAQRKPIAQPGLVGSLAKQPPASPSPRPSFRPTSRQPTASPAAAKRDHATRVMPAGAAAPVTPAGYDASLAQASAPASGLSAEQEAFMQRKAAEVRSPPPPTPLRGRSTTPRTASRPSSSSPAAAKWDHATRFMPAGAAAPVTPAGYDASLAQASAAAAAGSLSAEQAAFVQRKAVGQASTGSDAANPVPYSQRKPIAQPGLVGSLAKQPPSVAPASPSPRPSFRPTSRQPTASPAAAKWDHATRVMPAGAAPPVTPAGYDASLAQASAPASGLSAEQAAFVQRKAAEQASTGSDAANPVPYSQRKPIAQPGLVGSLAKQPPSSPSPRPSFRPTSRQPTASPAAAKWDHATRVMPAGAAAPVTPAGFDATLAQAPAAGAAAGLSAEQAAFVQRKAAGQASAGSGAANPVPYAQRKPIAQPGLVGSLAKQPPSVAPASPSPRPSFRPTSRQPTSSPAAAKWDHATRVMPAGSPPPVTPARYMHVSPEEAALLSKEQAEFLERKRAGGQ